MQLKHHLMAIFVAMIWGLDFVAAKAALQHFPLFFFLFLRFSLAFLLMFPFHHRLPIPLKKLAPIAFTLAFMHMGMIYLAIYMGLNASIAVLATQLRVPFALLLAVIVLGETIKWRSITGIFVSVLGALFLAGAPNVLSHWWAFLVAMGGALGWAIYNTQMKKIGEISYFALIAWISLLSAPLMLLISLSLETGQLEKLQTVTWPAAVSLVYVVAFSTILSHSLWYKLLSQFPVNHVVPYTLLVPLFGASAAAIVFNEPMSWPTIIGGMMTLVGVGIVVWRRPGVLGRRQDS